MAAKKDSQPKKRKKEVLIVDDHPIVREGIVKLLNHEADLTVCGEAEDAPQALKSIEKLKPHIAIVDITLKQGLSGIELIKDIKARYPRLPVLVLSMHNESLYAERTLRAGAKGYIMKQEATEKVVEAIRRVLAGEIYLSERMAQKILHKFVEGKPHTGESPIERLSDRELEVFQLIGHGLKTRRVAEKLHLSVKTIETYREHIKEKLKLKDAAELVQHAIQWVQSQSDGSSNPQS
jgi:DNA-binding NarL/FixJ family response regulator